MPIWKILLDFSSWDVHVLNHDFRAPVSHHHKWEVWITPRRIITITSDLSIVLASTGNSRRSMSPAPPPSFSMWGLKMGSFVCIALVLDCITLCSFVLMWVFAIGLGKLVTCYRPFFIWGSGVSLFVCTTLVLDYITLILFAPSLPLDWPRIGGGAVTFSPPPFRDSVVKNRLVRLYYVSTVLYHPHFVCTIFTLRDWLRGLVTFYPYTIWASKMGYLVFTTSVLDCITLHFLLLLVF